VRCIVSGIRDQGVRGSGSLERFPPETSQSEDKTAASTRTLESIGTPRAEIARRRQESKDKGAKSRWNADHIMKGANIHFGLDRGGVG